MPLRKLFISLPMRNRSVEDIRADMRAIHNTVEHETGEKFELIDTVLTSTPASDIREPSTWYLGNSILSLSKADVAVFHPDWTQARGCIIEHMICAFYDIPYLDMRVDYGIGDENADVVDHTRDYDFEGQINEALSEMASPNPMDDDIEDALGFEPDYLDDLSQDDIFTLEEGEYDADAE